MLTWLDRLQPFGALVMRLTLGAIMLFHGYGKIIPHGALYGFAHAVSGMHLPYWLGYVAAFTEFFGGIALILGLLTRIAALGVAIEMAVAIIKVHLHHGLTGNGGFEFPLACFALALMLVFTGAGYASLDQVLFRGKA
jgi:putative oxidoreductase